MGDSQPRARARALILLMDGAMPFPTGSKLFIIMLKDILSIESFGLYLFPGSKTNE
jgi:hypothetical protein